MFRACRPWLMFLALAVLPGCHFSGRAYEGATRPESSVSVLRGHNRVFGGGIFIQQVDSQTPFYPMLTKVEILPGRHTIQIVYSSYRPNYILSLPPMTAILETDQVTSTRSMAKGTCSRPTSLGSGSWTPRPRKSSGSGSPRDGGVYFPVMNVKIETRPSSP